MARVVGVTKVSLNDTDWGTMPGASAKLGGQKQDPVFASGVMAGFKATPVPFSLTCVFVWNSTTDIEAIRKHAGKCDFKTDLPGGPVYSSGDSVVDEDSVEIGEDGVKCTVIGTAAVKV